MHSRVPSACDAFRWACALDVAARKPGNASVESPGHGMQAEQFAGAMADAGGIGLAEALLPDLLALQENAQSSQIPPLAGAYR